LKTRQRCTPIAVSKKQDETEKGDKTFLETIREKPGTLLILPFVAIVGLDLVLNIFFMTKRSFEFFVLGQQPSTETWW